MPSLTPAGGEDDRKEFADALPRRAMLTVGAVVGAVAIPVLVEEVAGGRVEVTMVGDEELPRSEDQGSSATNGGAEDTHKVLVLATLDALAADADDAAATDEAEAAEAEERLD